MPPSYFPTSSLPREHVLDGEKGLPHPLVAGGNSATDSSSAPMTISRGDDVSNTIQEVNIIFYER